MGALIAYYRVSTKAQGDSGLGLEGQRAAVEAYARGGGHTITRSYKEVESGKKTDRPELAKALAHARRTSATIVIAKMDRLARNVHFLSGLMESGVEFVACDTPHANRLTIHILAAVAEDEARRISERTKAGLAAFKATRAVPIRLQKRYPEGVPPELAEAVRGRLGTHRPGAKHLTTEQGALGRRRSKAARRAKAIRENADLVATMRALRETGESYRTIAQCLNREGHTTRRNRPWHPMGVKRALELAAAGIPAKTQVSARGGPTKEQSPGCATGALPNPSEDPARGHGQEPPAEERRSA